MYIYTLFKKADTESQLICYGTPEIKGFSSFPGILWLSMLTHGLGSMMDTNSFPNSTLLGISKGEWAQAHSS